MLRNIAQCRPDEAQRNPGTVPKNELPGIRCASSETTMPKLKPGDPAPNFSVIDGKGKITHIIDSVDIRSHAEEVLALL